MFVPSKHRERHFHADQVERGQIQLPGDGLMGTQYSAVGFFYLLGCHNGCHQGVRVHVDCISLRAGSHWIYNSNDGVKRKISGGNLPWIRLQSGLRDRSRPVNARGCARTFYHCLWVLQLPTLFRQVVRQWWRVHGPFDASNVHVHRLVVRVQGRLRKHRLYCQKSIRKIPRRRSPGTHDRIAPNSGKRINHQELASQKCSAKKGFLPFT